LTKVSLPNTFSDIFIQNKWFHRYLLIFLYLQMSFLGQKCCITVQAYSQVRRVGYKCWPVYLQEAKK
jgi:hypothetical protein